MVLWGLIFCGLSGQMGAISNPEGLGLVSGCGQHLGRYCGLLGSSGESRAGKNLL